MRQDNFPAVTSQLIIHNHPVISHSTLYRQCGTWS